MKSPKKKIYLKPPEVRFSIWNAIVKPDRHRAAEKLAYIENYNRAVWVFNRHPAYKVHRELLAKYQRAEFELHILNDTIQLFLKETAAQQDWDRQWNVFLALIPITDQRLELTKHKISLLRAQGINNLASFADYKTLSIRGIGRRVYMPLHNLKWQLKKEFDYQPDQAFIAEAAKHIIESYPAKKQELDQTMAALSVKIQAVCEELQQASAVFDSLFPNRHFSTD